MATQEPLDALETDDAVRALRNTLLENPGAFSAAFEAATQTYGCTFDGILTSVASQWALDHSGGLANDEEAARLVANSLLGQAVILRTINPKARFVLVETLFPFFDLPPGWRKTAKEAGLRPGHIASFITERVRAIHSKEDAERDIAFIRQILAVPKTHGESTYPFMSREEFHELQETHYQALMSPEQLYEVARILWKFAPEEVHRAREARSKWSRGL